MFTPVERDEISRQIVAMGESDPRIVAAAIVGSLATGGGDRWSDIDLTFAVRDEIALTEVLDDWTERMQAEMDAVHLFDLPAGDTIYRVFLLPDGLQVDLSFTPASRFGAGGPRFRLLFGETHPRTPSTPQSAAELFGWGVAYARDGRACIERGRPWMAEHMISAVRDHALAIACVARGLPARYGRGYDDLPADLLQPYESCLIGDLGRESLLRALAVAVEALLREAEPVVDHARRVASSASEWLTAGTNG